MNTTLELPLTENIAPLRDGHAALSVRRVTKHFGGGTPLGLPVGKPSKRVIAVDDLTLSIRRGEIFGVLGANGSGKSTLIRLIATLLFPDEGTVEVFGYNVVTEAATVKRMINRVSVEASLFKKLSAMENLVYAARLYSVDVRKARPQITRILEALGIPENRIGKPVDAMSRGMQQKVAIARALLTSPILLLLDEPTTGLDPRSKKDVQAFVRELQQVHDATVLLTSHDMDEADSLCDRLAIVDRGKIVMEGTPHELKRDFARRQRLDYVPSLEDVFMDATGRSLDEEEEEGG